MTIEAVQNYNRLMAPVHSDLETLPVFTLFQTIFASSTGKLIIERDAEAIDIDIQRANKRLAVYIPRGSDARNLGNDQKDGLLEKYTSDSKIFPLIEEETPITSVMISKRFPGENPRAPMSRIMKQAALAMKAHREHMRRMIRKMEFSAGEALRTGIQTIQGGLTYDFYRRATHNVNAAIVWSTSATALPVGDISSAATKVFRDGNRRATDVVFGEGSWDNFLLTAQILALAESRRIANFVSDMNVDAPPGYEAWVAAGAVFQGQLKVATGKLNMWTYPAIYDDPTGTQTQYLPDDEVIVLAKGARFDRYYGPADRLEISNGDFFSNMFGINLDEGVPPNVQGSGIFQPNMFNFDAYGGNNNKALIVRSQVAPIFPTIETDAIVTITTE